MNAHYPKNTRFRAAIPWLAALLVGASAAAQAPKPKDDLSYEAEDPAVLAVLETNPTTPTECARAANLLAELRRPKLAKPLLQKLLAAKLTPDQYIELAQRFGTTMFTQMASNPDLAPEGGLVSEAVLKAVNSRLQDPKRIAAMIAQLQDPAEEKRAEAFAALREARGAAIGQLVAVLADSSRSHEHPMVRAVLIGMRNDAVDPLLGIFERSDPRLMVEAMRVLGDMGKKKAAVYFLAPYASDKSDPSIRGAAAEALRKLVGPLPTREQAMRLLLDNAKAFFENRQVVSEAVDGQLEMWSWDQGNRVCVVESIPIETARRMIAARFARDAYALNEEDHEALLLYLATMLEVDAYEKGLDKPPAEEESAAEGAAATHGMPVVEQVLVYAMEHDHPAAAAMAARILGRHGSAEELLRGETAPSPLVRATRSPDRRLRFAAVDAVMRLQPAGPFPGSSYIPQALRFFAATTGRPRILLGGPSTAESRELAGELGSLGYTVDTAATGREFIRKACDSPDYELALLDATIDGPRLDPTLQELRKESQGADLRVGILAPAGHLPAAQRVAARDPLAIAFSCPHDRKAVVWQVEQLKGLAPDRFVGYTQRQLQAAEALALLVELDDPSCRFYDLRSAEDSALTALHARGLSEKAIAILERTGTPESQEALVEFASRHTLPIEARKAAVKAFRQSIKENGLLLTVAQISRQYKRYAASKDLDENTQYIRGKILDAIELPTLATRQAQEMKKQGKK
jgi:CheY-like chemotaxis protein